MTREWGDKHAKRNKEREPGCSLSRIVDITFTDLISCCGPQSVHASSPKCKSANIAILNDDPFVIWRYLSAVVRRVTFRWPSTLFAELIVNIWEDKRRAQIILDKSILGRLFEQKRVRNQRIYVVLYKGAVVSKKFDGKSASYWFW